MDPKQVSVALIRMRVATAGVVMFLAAGCNAAETERTVKFACDNGEEVEVHFKPQSRVAVLLRNGNTKDLQRQPAASGFLYSSGHFSIRGKDDDLIVEVGKMVPLKCRAQKA